MCLYVYIYIYILIAHIYIYIYMRYICIHTEYISAAADLLREPRHDPARKGKSGLGGFMPNRRI